MATGRCADKNIYERKLTFHTPFVYSGECRDAVLTGFLPVVIQAAALQAFLFPFVYLFLTNDQKDLKARVFLLGKFSIGKLEGYILTNSEMRTMMAQVWSALAMMLTFGTLNPYAAVAITVNVLSQIAILKVKICHYFQLQAPDQYGRYELEDICANAQYAVHVMLWPIVVMSNLLFALYIFDMAYAEDQSLSHLGVVFVTIIFVLFIPSVVSNKVYFSLKSKDDERGSSIARISMTPVVTNPMITSEPPTSTATDTS